MIHEKVCRRFTTYFSFLHDQRCFSPDCPCINKTIHVLFMPYSSYDFPGPLRKPWRTSAGSKIGKPPNLLRNVGDCTLLTVSECEIKCPRLSSTIYSYVWRREIVDVVKTTVNPKKKQLTERLMTSLFWGIPLATWRQKNAKHSDVTSKTVRRGVTLAAKRGPGPCIPVKRTEKNRRNHPFSRIFVQE